jgi:hypothetical protein
MMSVHPRLVIQRELQVSIRRPRSGIPPLLKEFRVTVTRHRSVFLFMTAFVLLVSLAIFWARSEKAGNASGAVSSCERDGSDACHERLSSNKKITGCVAHYNQQRKECLVQTISKEQTDGGTSELDEVLDAKTDSFVASRIANSHVRGMRDNAVISGAPVALNNEQGAKTWFDNLMTR